MLDSVLEWVAADRAARAALLPALLQDVRLHLVEEEALEALVEEETLVPGELETLVEEARCFAASVQHDTAPPRLTPRSYSARSISVFCLYEEKFCYLPKPGNAGDSTR